VSTNRSPSDVGGGISVTILPGVTSDDPSAPTSDSSADSSSNSSSASMTGTSSSSSSSSKSAGVSSVPAPAKEPLPIGNIVGEPLRCWAAGLS
jgi:hypothetical protein